MEDNKTEQYTFAPEEKEKFEAAGIEVIMP